MYQEWCPLRIKQLKTRNKPPQKEIGIDFKVVRPIGLALERRPIMKVEKMKTRFLIFQVRKLNPEANEIKLDQRQALIASNGWGKIGLNLLLLSNSKADLKNGLEC